MSRKCDGTCSEGDSVKAKAHVAAKNSRRKWKPEVDKPDSVNVLSLNLLKKAEEIEKLAHEIRERSKG